MNRLIILFIGLLAVSSAYSQATIKKATRLFKDKDDLTSVIMVVPAGSVVNVVTSDTTFMKVDYEGNTGYIYTRHAEISKAAVTETGSESAARQKYTESPVASNRPVNKTRAGRYEYLENKYGQPVAGKIYSGKIWKGMRAEMVKDSWGSPRKINKVISNSVVKEQWYYNKTMLFFQNNTLVNWGPERD